MSILYRRGDPPKTVRKCVTCSEVRPLSALQEKKYCGFCYKCTFICSFCSLNTRKVHAQYCYYCHLEYCQICIPLHRKYSCKKCKTTLCKEKYDQCKVCSREFCVTCKPEGRYCETCWTILLCRQISGFPRDIIREIVKIVRK